MHQFHLNTVVDGILVIQEKGKLIDSIKQTAREVVQDFASQYELPTMSDKPYQAIIYEDSFGAFNLLLVKDKQFSGFHSLYANDLEQAIEFFKSRHQTCHS